MSKIGTRSAARQGCRLALFAGMLALSGCGMFSGGSSSSGAATGSAAACPTTAILQPLANTAVFAPGTGTTAQTRRPDNVAFYGILSEADAKCDNSGGALRIRLDVVVIGERGPAAGKVNGVDLTYFVAVTGPDQSIIGKKPFAVHIEIPPTARRAGVTDHIEEALPLEGRKASDLNVVLGFQLSPQVVDFYKHFRGR